jgi:hypothetical protein
MLTGSVEITPSSNSRATRGVSFATQLTTGKTGEEMAIQQGATNTWTKSSYSGGNGACVEVKSAVPHEIAVRDSKVTEGPSIAIAPGAWTAFVSEVTEGAFNCG